MRMELKTLTVGLVAAAALGAAAGEARDAAWVDRRASEWEVRPDERRFDQAGWAPDVRSALRLAREHGRPAFLFTHDGHMNVGRC